MTDRPIEPWQVKVLACSLEHRGNDATGVAVQFDDGKIEVMKDHEPAWNFLCAKKTEEWLDAQLSKPEARTVLVHTRKMTKGSQYRNANNHPMHSGKAAVVHNGMIMNDDQLFTSLNLKRTAETDSDILRAIIDDVGFTRKLIGSGGKLCRVSGSVAAAAVHPDAPGKLLLLRSNNPLMVGSNRDHLCFASTKRSVYLALKAWIDRFGIRQAVHDNSLAFVAMPNNTGWIMGDKLEWHDLFNASNWSRTVNYNVHTPDYRDRRSRAEKLERERKEKEAEQAILPNKEESTIRPTLAAASAGSAARGIRPEFVKCTGVQQSGNPCDVVLDLRTIAREKKLSDLQCPKCQTNLFRGIPCDKDGEVTN